MRFEPLNSPLRPYVDEFGNLDDPEWEEWQERKAEEEAENHDFDRFLVTGDFTAEDLAQMEYEEVLEIEMHEEIIREQFRDVELTAEWGLFIK